MSCEPRRGLLVFYQHYSHHLVGLNSSRQPYTVCIWLYSGTPFIRSPMAQKNLAVFKRVFFLQENEWRFFPGDQKKWPYQRGDRKAGFHCIFHVGDVSATEFGAKNKPSEIAKIFWMTKKDKMRIS